MSEISNRVLTVMSNGRGYFGRTITCTCGHQSNIEITRGYTPSCPDCGNERVIEIDSYLYKRKYLMDVEFKTIRKDNKGFHITKQEYRIAVDSDSVRYTSKGDFYELIYDLPSRSFEVKRNGKQLHPNDSNLDRALKHYFNTYHILPYISTEHNEEFYRYIIKRLGAIGQEYVNKWSRALRRSFQYPALEILSACGFSLNNVGHEQAWTQSKETKPHKILGIPKYLLPFFKEVGRFTSHNVTTMVELDKELNGNNVKTALEILQEEGSIMDMLYLNNEVVSLYKHYGYRDIKRLFLYVCREVKLQQGITSPREALVLLRDYVRMSKEMGFTYDKYPNSLKKCHDIALMNYKIKEDEFKAKAFREVVSSEDYSNLEYRGKEFSIISPKESRHVVEEGSSLSHCVASYVNDIIERRCKIFFLRYTDKLDKPLVTVEVRGNNIRQARGEYNRKTSNQESLFLTEWAKEKELNVDYY